ncbi:Cof-type HAD-IIB family hydrolase [Cellulophaga sp. E16_2]|uniref:Cof-like hydrolase n=1 Tax=Cellulophaga algicola (strain DSM 14237 / IC166 / ACAM 630) TaxID=688270 RepID=E6X9U6_CELAD|nr:MULTISPECIES: HAD family hydrolase [Cellulophaga]ADV49866.1 Cof-like hydrolase [Cellulophaga algicola DSM 14237]MBO0592249.1 Cof-type HAD-IIB family hydrolase [Cellulophaga sp. E16_2]
MDLSQIKMVVTDMDGTLLNSNHQVSDKFYQLYEELKKRDIKFVAASGRQYHSIIDKLAPIKNEIIVISENGGFAMQHGKEILVTPLPNKTKNEIISLLNGVKNIHLVLCGKNCAYISKESSLFEQKLKEYYSNYELLDNLSAYDGEIVKIAIYHFESSEKYIYPKVFHLEDELQVKISGANWVDISSKNANKGYALEKVMKENNIKPHELLVFGDYNNDLEMLALADYSIAMENAHPNVLKLANYSTSNNDNYGVERILEKLIASK